MMEIDSSRLLAVSAANNLAAGRRTDGLLLFDIAKPSAPPVMELKGLGGEETILEYPKLAQ